MACRFWVGFFVSSAMLACGGDLSPQAAQQSGDAKPCAEVPESLLPAGQDQLPTTAGSIYIDNLRATIGSLLPLVTGGRRQVRNCVAFSSSLHAYGQYLGDIETLASALVTLDECLPDRPPTADVRLLRSNQLQTLHRFDEARAALMGARGLGIDDRVDAAERELDWNDGEYDRAMVAFRAAAQDAPTMNTLARLALVEHALGNYTAADAAFAQAEAAIVDTSPLAVAWLAVQRGHHHLELEEYAIAEVFFREALARLPGYIAAEEHLAEVLYLEGNILEAIEVYESVVEASDNPEFYGALAKAYRAAGRQQDAAIMIDRARLRYNALLVDHPAAMYWHAADFFAGIGGDPDRAVELLLDNALLRPNSPAWMKLAKVQLAVGQVGAAKASIDRALAMPLVSAELYNTASEIEAALRNLVASEAYRARAQRLAGPRGWCAISG